MIKVIVDTWDDTLTVDADEVFADEASLQADGDNIVSFVFGEIATNDTSELQIIINDTVYSMEDVVNALQRNQAVNHTNVPTNGDLKAALEQKKLSLDEAVAKAKLEGKFN